MKLAGVALLLLAAMVFVMGGCSDNPTQPISPTDQSVGEPSSLEKACIREYQGTAAPDWADPGVIIKPPEQREVDGKLISKGMLEKVVWDGAFLDGGIDLVSGKGVLELNAIVDPAAGEVFCWGKLTLTPSAPEALGGVWEVTYHGKGKAGASGWTLPLKMSGRGVGGALQGMRCVVENVITSPDLVLWTGAVTGYIGSR